MPRITFGSLKLNRAILEIKYPKGYLYWDVCGKCISEINSQSGGKIDFQELREGECILKFVGKPNAQASFGINRITLSAMKLNNINLFKENAPLILDLIKTYLEIQNISRAGFRLFHVLKKESYEDAEQFVNALDLYSVSADRFRGFGDNVSVSQPNVIVSDQEDKTRISIGAARRQDADDPAAEFDEFAPRYAVLTDIDFYKENIVVNQFDLKLFIHRSERKIKEHIAQLLNR